MTALILSFACRLPEPPPPVPSPPEQGAVIGLRSAEATAITDGRGQLGGGDNATPDAQGFVFYLGVPPGRTQVAYALDGAAVVHGAPVVQPETLSIWTTTPLPLEGQTIDDPSSLQSIAEGAMSLEIPAASVALRGEPFAEPYTAGVRALTPDQSDSAPGSSVALIDDDELVAVSIEWVGAARAWSAEGDDLSLLPESENLVSVQIPDGSDWASDPPRVFTYIPSKTYWQDQGTVQVDASETRVTFPSALFGWWAIGRHATDRACISGRVVDDGGAPVEGAEVRLYEEGAVTVDRMTAQRGQFCLSSRAGAPVRIAITAVGRDRSALYTGSIEATAGGPAACGACTDLGDIPLARWPDADGDRAWSGPGGDCDDSDPDVNPNPTLGDGSWCGGAL